MAHSEITVGRAPIQIASIETQRCANQYACGGCRAGLGVFDTSDLSVNFARTGLDNGYSATNATLTRIPGGVNLAATAANPQLGDFAATGFDGSAFRYVVVWGRVNSNASPEFTCFYQTSGAAGSSATRSMVAQNYDKRFRGVVLELLQDGEFVAVFDAADSTDFATTWAVDTVDGLRFDFGSGDDVDVDIYSVQASPTNIYAQRGAECYRTRATCQSLDEYRALPTAHLVPTISYQDGDDLELSDYDTTGPVFFDCNVRADITPDGVIIAAGAGDNLLYFGITGDNLVLRAGGSGATNIAEASIAASTISARTVRLIAEVDFDGGAVSIWEFDPTTYRLTLLATGTASAGNFDTDWAGGADGQVGTDGGNSYTGEDGGDWAGKIYGVTGFDGLLFDGRADEAFSLVEFYGMPNQEKPTDDIVINPYLQSVTTAPTKVSLGGSNTNAKALGFRASVRLGFADGRSSDVVTDPYRTDRRVDPLTQPGSYWGRWRVRQKAGRFGATITIYEGYKGQALADMFKRQYLLETLQLPSRNNATVAGRDLLSRTEFKRAQTPTQSPGLLNAAIDDTTTTVPVKGATLQDYPAPGTVRINREIMTFSAAVVNGGDPDVIDLTVARATDRSVANDHNADDSVQLCTRWTDARVSEIMTDLLADTSLIPAQLLDLANWQLEDDSFLSTYVFDALVTKPTGASTLVGELIESAAAYTYVDERAQLVRLKALTSLVTTPQTLVEGRDIIADSFSLVEKPAELATRVQVYYNQNDFADEVNDPTDFVAGYIIANPDLEQADAFGVKQTRTIRSRFINSNAQASQTAARLAQRYEEIPIEVTFAADAKDRSIWIGDNLYLRHRQLVGALGEYDQSRVFTVTSAEEIVPGQIMRYTVEDATLAGFIYFITDDAQPDYSGDPDQDALNGFITDDDGLNADGTQGAQIT